MMTENGVDFAPPVGLTCIGAGLLALDVVLTDDPKTPPSLWAGGSCGNVMAILAYLGWDAYPIACLGSDVAARHILEDFSRWGMKTSLISKVAGIKTPVIIERIRRLRNGKVTHRYEWVCPNCGFPLPKYKPFPVRDVESIREYMPSANVFFFDRVVPSSLALAKINKDRGALIMFEPSAIRDEKLFLDCLKISDIVKYSQDRLGDAHDLFDKVPVPLEIETLGADGLRYRYQTNHMPNPWRQMNAYTIENVKDSAGSGDWTSAGVLYTLGTFGKKGFSEATIADIEKALTLGQAFAALNCQFEGARGVMYATKKAEFEDLVFSILKNDESLNFHKPFELDRHFNGAYCFSSICQGVDELAVLV